VLVLDEPTASLDIRHEMELFELIRQLVDAGLAGLVITHHLNLAARFADRILLLDRGLVVADGVPSAVLNRETLSRVFEWPVAVRVWSDGSPQVVPLRAGEKESHP
jgi:iron complex transport system ATP-binding protein